jgi:hypothetical protein
MLRCRGLGHRYRFAADGNLVRWHCERCGAALGAREYASAADARRYARGLDRSGGADLGRRALPFALFPLRLVRRLRRPS